MELRLWLLIGEGLASKFELEEYYTLDEALKLYALWRMKQDIETAKTKELANKK